MTTLLIAVNYSLGIDMVDFHSIIHTIHQNLSTAVIWLPNLVKNNNSWIARGVLGCVGVIHRFYVGLWTPQYKILKTYFLANEIGK